jgi:hypothetical protein
MAGAGSPQVARRLRSALEDLLSVAPADRTAVLEDQLDRLAFLTRETMSDEADADMALAPDRQGVGEAAGTRTG